MDRALAVESVRLKGGVDGFEASWNSRSAVLAACAEAEAFSAVLLLVREAKARLYTS